MVPVPPIDDEPLPMGAEELVSGIGVVALGAVLAGVLGAVSTFLPQAPRASKAADSATMVTGVRRLNERGFIGASLKGK
jgi:hypothetical protein